MLKKNKLAIFISIACIFLGCVIFGITVINNGYYFDKVFYPYEYSTETYTNDLSEINEIEINLQDVHILIYENPNNELRLTYNEYENRKYTFSGNDKLSITIEDIDWTSYLTFNLKLKNTAKLYIPVGTTLPIKIHKNNDNIVIKDEILKDKIILI